MHVLALERALGFGFEPLVLSAPPPFRREDARRLIEDASVAIGQAHPDAAGLYATRGWQLPPFMDRVYDPSRAQRVSGCRFETDFGSVFEALREHRELPFVHDPTYTSPTR